MRTLTITFVLALLVVAGCGSNTTPTSAAPPQPKTDAAATTNLPKLWDFWATWCPPCKQLNPIIDALEKEYEGEIEIRSINVDEDKSLSEKFNVEAIPTLVFLDASGKELSRIVGLTPKDTIVGRFKAHGFIE